MIKILRNLIVSRLEHLDALVQETELNRKTIQDLVVDIISADKKKEDTAPFFNKQRFLTAKTSLLEQDIGRVVLTLNNYYTLSKSVEGDLELEESEI